MSTPAPARTVARRQLLAALFVFSALATVCGSLACITRSKSLTEWVARDDEAARIQSGLYIYHDDWYQSQDELLLYDQLPRDDYSKGGVYFLGSSSVLYSTKFWELSPGLQALVHNYGIVNSTPKCESLFLRYLIEQRGMLQAGGEKNLVIFGTFYPPVAYPSQSLPPSWVDPWEARGLFTCDPQQGIRPVQVPGISKFLTLEKLRQANCVFKLRDVFLRHLAQWRHRPVETTHRHNPAQYMASRREEMGTDWKQNITDEVSVFRETVDYLQSRHVQIRVAFMPEGSWDFALPYGPEYRRQLTTACAEKHVPISDWSRLITDDEFADSSHVKITDVGKIQDTFLEIALPFLRSTHALPATPSSQNQPAP